MCGRLHNKFDFRELRLLVDWLSELESEDDVPVEPRWNIAPTERVPVLLREGDRFRVRMARWGLVPAWWREPKLPGNMFNARAEGLPMSPAFRSSSPFGRVLVLTSRFSEWQKVAGGKRPLAIHEANGPVLGMASLAASWRSGEGEPALTATVITAALTEAMVVKARAR